MDKDQKPQSGNEKQADKKSSPQGGNLVWYLLALGVLLLLMVTMFNSNSGLTLGFSDFLKLVDASGKDGHGSIEVPDPSSSQPQRIRLSELSSVVVGSSTVTAKVTRERLKVGATKTSSEKEPEKEKGV